MRNALRRRESSQCIRRVTDSLLTRFPLAAAVRSVACVLSLFFALYDPISSELVGAFLCPVLAIIATGASLGHSFDLAWQVTKGTAYACVLGVITNGQMATCCRLQQALDIRTHSLDFPCSLALLQRVV